MDCSPEVHAGDEGLQVRRRCCSHVQLMKQTHFNFNNYSCHWLWNSFCFRTCNPKRIVSMAETIFTVTGLNMHSRDSDWLILLHCFHSDSPHTERGCQLKSLNKSQPGRKVRSKKQRTFTQESTRDSQCSDPHQTVIRRSLVRCNADAIFRSDWQSAP